MTSSYTTAWRLAIFSFAFAAGTGALLRYGMYAGLPGGLLLGDVRHAHSHLMFFSWATPALILLATGSVRQAGASFRSGPWLAIAAVAAGLLAYVPFLLSGYRLMPLGEAELPLSMMASGLNGAVWYALALAYLRATRGLRRTASLRLFDGSVALLVLSSVGAVLLAVGGITGTASQAQMDAFVDMYLTLFADGWFGLGVLAALVSAVFVGAVRRGRQLSVAAWTLTAALGVRTLTRLGVDAYGLGGLAAWESASGALAAVAWLWVVGLLLRSTRLSDDLGSSQASGLDATSRVVAVLVLALIALKAVVEFAVAFPAGEAFVARQGLRVFLLHAFLLGAVTLGLAAAMRARLSRWAWRGLGWFALAVGVMLFLLLPLTGLWPVALSGPWALRAAFYSSLGPPLAALVTLALTGPLSWPARGPGRSRSAAPTPSRPQA